MIFSHIISFWRFFHHFFFVYWLNHVILTVRDIFNFFGQPSKKCVIKCRDVLGTAMNDYFNVGKLSYIISFDCSIRGSIFRPFFCHSIGLHYYRFLGKWLDAMDGKVLKFGTHILKNLVCGHLVFFLQAQFFNGLNIKKWKNPRNKKNGKITNTNVPGDTGYV